MEDEISQPATRSRRSRQPSKAVAENSSESTGATSSRDSDDEVPGPLRDSESEDEIPQPAARSRRSPQPSNAVAESSSESTGATSSRDSDDEKLVATSKPKKPDTSKKATAKPKSKGKSSSQASKDEEDDDLAVATAKSKTNRKAGNSNSSSNPKAKPSADATYISSEHEEEDEELDEEGGEELEGSHSGSEEHAPSDANLDSDTSGAEFDDPGFTLAKLSYPRKITYDKFWTVEDEKKFRETAWTPQDDIYITHNHKAKERALWERCDKLWALPPPDVIRVDVALLSTAQVNGEQNPNWTQNFCKGLFDLIVCLPFHNLKFLRYAIDYTLWVKAGKDVLSEPERPGIYFPQYMSAYAQSATELAASIFNADRQQLNVFEEQINRLATKSGVADSPTDFVQNIEKFLPKATAKSPDGFNPADITAILKAWDSYVDQHPLLHKSDYYTSKRFNEITINRNTPHRRLKTTTKPQPECVQQFEDYKKAYIMHTKRVDARARNEKARQPRNTGKRKRAEPTA